MVESCVVEVSVVDSLVVVRYVVEDSVVWLAVVNFVVDN